MAFNEEKWQKKWLEAGLQEGNPSKGKKFFLIFAYPGVSGFLHVGHMRGYTYSDVITRYKRAQGFNVLFPAGFHATGIHALAIANNVKKQKKEQIDYLVENGLPKGKLKSFEDYKNVLKYFFDLYENEYWKKFGFLIDWRRMTNTLDPGYQKFIQWQFRKLKQKNLLVQKPYYGASCPNCGPVAVDASETDLKSGGTAEKLEFTLLKFKYEDGFIVAASLRPETVYGQTNMWANPEVDYVEANVDGEKWICSKECLENLKNQGKKITINRVVPGTQLLGKTCIAPGIEKEIPIFPATFCDPAVGTGLVTSVPSDAPYDYIALKDLEKDKTWGEQAKKIEIIPIIKSKGFGDFPAKEICERMGITSQKDVEKLEKATQEIYKIGFHTGVLNMNCNKYEGMKATEAKDAVKIDLIQAGKADTMYSFSEPVVCRCGTSVVIKKIDDQWFIKYSDKELTKNSKEQAAKMTIVPEDYHKQMPEVLDWFEDRPCVRQGSWLGTPFPFDEKWIIEPISDSTLYPLFYLVSLYQNEGKIKPEEMDEKFFDYVFLGKGEAANDVWAQIRKDVEYWYPLDVNLGGKEHKTVHFPVFLMNHVAVMPEKHRPQGIFVNWWVLGTSGGKLSKSKGGASGLPGAIKQFSVDAMRLYYCHVASASADVYWDEKNVFQYKEAVERVLKTASALAKQKGKESAVDEWLKHNFDKRLEKVTAAMDAYDLRTAADEAVYGVLRDLQWYKRRGGGSAETILAVVSSWAKVVCPFIPHVAEEVWQCTGNMGLVSAEEWPKLFGVGDASTNVKEALLEKVLEDVRNIQKIVGKPPESVTVFVASKSKWKAIEKIKKAENLGEAMKLVMGDAKLRSAGKGFVQNVFSNKESVVKVDELKVLKEAKKFLEAEIGCKVDVVAEEKSKHDKAKKALPLKPAILVD